MEIDFASKRLERLYTDSVYSAKELGPAVSRKYIQRIELIYSASNFEEVRSMPGFRCHLLEPRKKNYWAISLDQRWRLIVMPVEGKNCICIEQVNNHYGD